MSVAANANGGAGSGDATASAASSATAEETAVYLKGLPKDEPVSEMHLAVKKMFMLAGRVKRIKIYGLVRWPRAAHACHGVVVPFDVSDVCSAVSTTLCALIVGIQRGLVSRRRARGVSKSGQRRQGAAHVAGRARGNRSAARRLGGGACR
jgi:hypothetical protein